MGQTGDSHEDVEGLLEAVNYYHEYATSDFTHILEATQRFEALAAQHPVTGDHPAGWLPAYWTAFAYSQLALFAKDNRLGPYVELAQLYYQRAWSGKPSEEPRMNADLFALKGLILGFVQTADPANAGKHKADQEEQWEMARSADPNNPMVLMNQGLTLIRDTETRARAYELLDRAIERYEPRLDKTEPNWGREFIDVWMGSYPRLNDGEQAEASGAALVNNP